MAFSPANILVVDGGADSREHTCGALARASYRCFGVVNATEALRVARDERVDVALVDLGDEADASTLWLARRLRDEVRDLAVVIVTGTPSLDAALDAMRVGVLDYLFTPFSEDDLIEAVDRAVEWRGAAVRQRASIRQVEQDLVHRMAQLQAVIAEAAIASTPALDVLVDSLYAANRPALAHARRVALHASRIASSLGGAAADVDDIARAGLLHDVGKLALPERITAKATPLTDHEMTLFRSHPELGAELIRPVPILRGAAAIVAATRERYDGSGYPGGLRRDAIPLGSSIVAVVDLFDSLTGNSAWGDPLPVAAANAELVKAAATQFDPVVVAAWMRYADNGLPEPAWQAVPWSRA
jgi:putative nucleotidyltransferase with HDIG domain